MQNARSALLFIVALAVALAVLVSPGWAQTSADTPGGANALQPVTGTEQAVMTTFRSVDWSTVWLAGALSLQQRLSWANPRWLRVTRLDTRLGPPPALTIRRLDALSRP